MFVYEASNILVDDKNMHFVIMCFKDIYFCQIEIIKGLTDKGQFHKIKGASRGDLPVYNTQFISLRSKINILS